MTIEIVLQAIERLDEKNDRAHERITGEIKAVSDKQIVFDAKLKEIKPQVELACKKANCATEATSNIKGQWKILFYFLSATVLASIGYWLRDLILFVNFGG